MSLKAKLQARLSELGYAPKRALGQNFLINETAIEKILKKTSELAPAAVIEIGPGLGALTDGLRSQHPNLRVIELDRGFAQYWRNQGLEVHEEDALQINWPEKFGSLPRPLGLVSNLPYQIAARLVIELSLSKLGPDFMVLMFQKEVAVKIRAAARTPDYGLLSVIAQSFWDIEMVLELSSGDFFPPPKVASRVLSFRRKHKGPTENTIEFLEFLKASFHQRRKLLRNNLGGWLGRQNASLEQLDLLLVSLKHSVKARAEELTVSDFIRLFHELSRSV